MRAGDVARSAPTGSPQVIPGMRFLGENRRGTLLFVDGGTALVPMAHLTGTSIAVAGETAYVELLHEALATG
jgi:hypothetical protein